MHVQRPLRDGETQPDTSSVGVARRLHPKAWSGQARQKRIGHTRAVVPDGNEEVRVVLHDGDTVVFGGA